MSKNINLLEGFATQQLKEQVSQEIFEGLLKLVPSNYTSTVQGPFYTIQFKAFADFLAEIQVSAETLYEQSLFNLVNPDFLQDTLNILLLPNGEILDIKNLADYKLFLIQFLAALLKGARQSPIQETLQGLTDDSIVEIVDRLSGSLEDSFFVDVYIKSSKENNFTDNFYALRNNIDIIINALKPAHILHEYQNLFSETAKVLSSNLVTNSFSIDLDFRYQQEMRKNFLGAKSLKGSCTLDNSYTLTDSNADFSRVRPGSDLWVTYNTKLQFVIKSKTKKSLTITSWFPASFLNQTVSYEIELDELGQIEPRHVIGEILTVDSKGVAYTSFGPLVRAAGDEKLATTSDIEITSPGSGITLTKLDSYSGKLQFSSAPAGTPASAGTQVTVSYYWYPNPILPAGGLNTAGAVLNKWGYSGSSNSLNRFPFRHGLNKVRYPQPLIYSPRYIGLLKEGSTTLNNTLAKLNSTRLNRINQGSSNEYLYAKSFKTITYTSVNKIINLKSGGITVESIKSVATPGPSGTLVEYTFDKQSQKLTVTGADTSYSVTFIPGLPVTRKFLLEQPLYESADVLYGGSAPFFDPSEFSKVERLDASNAKEDLIDNTLLQFFSDGVLKSDGFVEMSLDSDSYTESGVLKPSTSYPPLYLWSAPDSTTGRIAIGADMTISVDQTRLWSSDNVNILTSLTDPELPQVQVELKYANNTSSKYVIS